MCQKNRASWVEVRACGWVLLCSRSWETRSRQQLLTHYCACPSLKPEELLQVGTDQTFDTSAAEPPPTHTHTQLARPSAAPPINQPSSSLLLFNLTQVFQSSRRDHYQRQSGLLGGNRQIKLSPMQPLGGSRTFCLVFKPVLRGHSGGFGPDSWCS